MTQEIDELSYQLMEMLEQERELRARTEQASLHRIEELEAQVVYFCKFIMHIFHIAF